MNMNMAEEKALEQSLTSKNNGGYPCAKHLGEMINGTLSPTLCLSKTAEHDQQLLSHHRKKPGNLYLIGPNTKNLTLPRQTIFRLLFVLPACEAWLKSLILRRHLSFLLGVLFNFLIFHFTSASLVLPFDSPPAVNEWPPHPKALLSSV